MGSLDGGPVATQRGGQRGWQACVEVQLVDVLHCLQASTLQDHSALEWNETDGACETIAIDAPPQSNAIASARDFMSHRAGIGDAPRFCGPLPCPHVSPTAFARASTSTRAD